MRARKKPKLKQKPNPWEAKKKVTNPMENIKNLWEAMIKVTNPTENLMENLLEVLYLPEVQNCPQTPMGEREEEMVVKEAVQKLLVLPETYYLIPDAVNVADSEIVDPVEAAEAVHQGALVPQKRQGKEKPEVIFYYVKSAV